MMTPERFQQIDQLYQAALDLDPEDRSKFISSACADDAELRREVESLLAAHEQAGSFIAEPALQSAAKLLASDQAKSLIGSTLAHYRIESILGKGGMGEVYLALDVKLKRKVALKLLPDSFNNYADQLSRFEREAWAASALNHPNIVTIHEIGQTDSLHYIATEFVDGETLREHLTKRRMTIGEVLDIGAQVASALQAAHEAGIVHRDIKPENIMLRRDGLVKVLDFGLAKLAPDQVAVHSQAPTRPMVNTNPGVVMGTVSYMSPEQARGTDVDARTDIWSLGAVIYEMVFGYKPFTGETTTDVLAAILKTEPPLLSHLNVDAPTDLVRIVSKALRKEREERYQFVRDLLLDLKSLKEELAFQAKLERSVGSDKNGAARDDGGPAQLADIGKPRSDTNAISTITQSLSSEIKPRNRWAIPAMTALIFATVAAVITLYKVMNRSRPDSAEPTRVLRTRQLTFSTGVDNFPSLSPDGKSVVYSSDQNGTFEIYIKQLISGGGELQLTNDGKHNSHPSWSPDGQRISYYSKTRGGIWLVSALGGSPKQLVEFGCRPSWSPDGSLIAFQSGTPGEVYSTKALPPSNIWIVPTQGGAPKQVTQTGYPPGGHSSVSWAPDGKKIAFVASDYIFSSAWSVAVEGGSPKKIADGWQAFYAPDGQHVYVVGVAGFSKIPLSSTGEPGLPVTVSGSAPNLQYAAISADGKKIVYSGRTIQSNLWRVSLSAGSAVPLSPPSAFTRDTSQRNNLAVFSPDGRKLALTRWRSESGADIWVADSDGRNLTQLTSNPATDTQPGWLPDSDRLVFLSNRENREMMLWTISLATRKEEPFLNLGEGAQFARLSPDGGHVAINLTQNGAMNIWLISTKNGQRQQLTFDGQLMGFPCWSPDSKLIAFEMKRGDDDYLMVIPSSGGQPTQLTFDPGKSWPDSWSPDGDKIAFAGQRDGIWNIYWISVSTKTQKQLTNYSKPDSFVRYPAWSPRGNEIVYEYAETKGNIWLAELQ